MVRGWLLVVGGLAGCRGFFDTPPVSPDAPPGADTGPAGSIQYVQSQLVSDSGSYTQASFPLPEQAGDTNVVVVSWTVGSLIDLHDDAGNVYATAIGPTSTAQVHQAIFVANGVKGSADKITVTFDITTLMRVGLVEYSGVAAQPVDQVTGMSGDMTTPPMTGTLATTSANDLLVAAAFSDPQLGSTSIVGFTPRIGATELRVADVAAASTGTYSGNVMTSLHGAWIMQLVALRPR